MQATVTKIIRESIEHAEASGFALLKKIPGSERFHFLDYYSEIDSAERCALKNALASRGAALLGFAASEEDASRFAAVLKRQADRRGWSGNWRYLGVRQLRMMRSILRAEPDHAIVRDAPKEALDKIAKVETAKAAELRKVAKLAFSQLLGAKPVAHQFGLWEYPGKLKHEDVAVRIDYGSIFAQVRYGVLLRRFEREIGHREINYESLHGFGHGWWDQIEEHRADEAFAVMAEAIEETVNLCVKIHDAISKGKPEGKPEGGTS